MCTSPEKYARRSLCNAGRTLLAVVVSALVLVAFPARAQDSGESADAGAQITREECSRISNLVEAQMAYIEVAQLALTKSASPQILAFARQEIDEHGAALEDLRTLAQASGVSLPDETTIRSKSQSVALKNLSGSLFDQQYLKRIGLNEHQRLMGLLQEAQANSRDPALQALVEKMLPTVQRHLQKARQITVQRDSAKPANTP